MSVDLEAYFARIKYDGPRTPDLGVLRAVHLAHCYAIPFENLEPLVERRAPALDLDALQAKLVRDGRGGYCFEHNNLLRHVLASLGFQVTQLLARVRWQVPEERPTGLTHKLLRIDLGDRVFLVDVGFGGTTPSAPLELLPGVEQATPHEPYRIVRNADGRFETQVKLGDEFHPAYRWTLDPQAEIDDLAPNWYAATHPQSHFTQMLSVARILPGERLSLRNFEFSRRPTFQDAEKRTVASADELRRLLVERFGIAVPAAMKFDQLFLTAS